MKKESLKENIAKILGVSSLEKELALEVFLEKVAESIDYDQAIKIDGLGVFQLKKNVPSKDEQSYIGNTDPRKDKVIYSAFDQKSSRESNSLFLSFDVKAKSKNEFEFDDEIFSPGVGKPIPINTENEDSDSSIHMIKKSLEERVTELIEESEKVNNFDIWDDFYKNVDKNIEDDSQEIELTDVDSSQIELSDEEEVADEIIQKENEHEINSENEENISLSEEDEFDSDSIFPEEMKSEEENIPASGVSFSQDEIDKLLSNVSVEDDADLIAENDSTDDSDLSAFAELTRYFDHENQNEDKIDDDFDASEINDELDEDDPFASLEKTFNGEIDVDNLDEDSREPETLENDENEIDNKENIEEEVESSKEENKLTDEGIHPSHTIEFSPDSDKQVEKIDGKSLIKKFGLLFWGIAAIFVLVTVGGVYFLFFNESQITEKPQEAIVAVTDSLKKDSVVNPIVERIDSQSVKKEDLVSEEDPIIERGTPVVEKENPVEKKETPIVAEVFKKPETTSENKSTISNVDLRDEVEVSRFIFTNGTKYSVQVSSWKKKSIADQEAYRFEAMGYKAAVVEAELSKLGTWYRVRVGYFDTIEKAKEFQNKQK